jgi:subtilisin family serine protease
MLLFDCEVKQILNVLPQSYIDWGMKLIGADKAWEKYTGKGIKVGIIDTGIDYSHSDLAPNIAKYKSFIDDTDGVDANFHGTHVAGISCGRNNGTGIVGVAPKAKIYSAKIFDKNSKTTATAEMKALEWMAEEGVHVVNMSYGGLFPIDIPGVKESLQKYHDCVKAVADAGVIMVAAAGNAGNSRDTLDRISWPARFPETFAVGAICQELQRADFSSTGDMLDFAMPGVDVYSCYPGNKWARYSGTSMAAPFLTGSIALLQEYALKTKGRVFTFEEVKNELAKYAIDLGVEGIDPEYGYGMVNIGKIGAAIMDKLVIMLDQPMTIQNNRTLAPLRFVIETNGGQVLGWDNTTKTVTFKTPSGKKVTMQVNNPEVTIEG